MPEAWNLGETLRNVREKKRMTIAEVAEATHMKTSVVEAIERNDFGRFAAPVYAKGFIKLYAECLELDPTPFLQAYEMGWGARPQPSPRVEAVPAAGSDVEGGTMPSLVRRLGISLRQQWYVLWFLLRNAWQRRLSYGTYGTWRRPRRGETYGGEWIWRYAGIGLAALLVVVLLTSAAIRWTRRGSRTTERKGPTATSAVLRLAEEPPAPYADIFRR